MPLTQAATLDLDHLDHARLDFGPQVSATALLDALLDAATALGFRPEKLEERGPEGFSLRCGRGGKLRAFLTQLIPFGAHLSGGKRLLLRAEARREGQDGLILDLRVLPRMELFNEEEMFTVTQGAAESVTDQHHATRALHLVVRGLYQGLGQDIPEPWRGFDSRKVWWHSLLASLVFAMEPLSKGRTIHMPPPVWRWNWSALVLGPIWFLWNELRGATPIIMAPFALVYAFAYVLNGFREVSWMLWVAWGSCGLFAALLGDKIFYMRYGHWPNRGGAEARKPLRLGWNMDALLLGEFWFLWNNVWTPLLLALAMLFLVLLPLSPWGEGWLSGQETKVLFWIWFCCSRVAYALLGSWMVNRDATAAGGERPDQGGG